MVVASCTLYQPEQLNGYGSEKEREFHSFQPQGTNIMPSIGRNDQLRAIHIGHSLLHNGINWLNFFLSFLIVIDINVAAWEPKSFSTQNVAS